MTRQVLFKDELTISTAGGMANELLNALQGGQDVLVDFSGATRIDCAALQILVAAMKEANLSGVTMTCRVPADIQIYASSLGVSI